MIDLKQIFFPLRFTISKLLEVDNGYNINTNVIGNTYPYPDKPAIEKYKKEVEAFIEKETMQEKRIASLEEKIRVLEDSLKG